MVLQQTIKPLTTIYEQIFDYVHKHIFNFSVYFVSSISFDEMFLKSCCIILIGRKLGSIKEGWFWKK